MNDLIGYREAARMLGLPIGTLYSMVSKRHLPHLRLGPRLVRFDPVALQQWVESHRVGTEAASARGA